MPERFGPSPGWRWVPPPGWPEPPPGWYPYPGWRPDPAWPPAPSDWRWWVPTAAGTPVPGPGHLDPGRQLDREVAEGLPGSNWGLGEVAKAAGWFVLISAVLATLFLFVVPSGGEASLAGESTLGIAAVMAVRKPVRQSGGWRKALGWSLPGWRDAKWIAIWIGWQLLARYATTLVMLVLVPALRHQVVTNTGPIQHAGGVSLALLVATAVLVAPPVEELLFRGLLLRAAMRRFRFVPAALFSSVVFGLGHAPEAGTLAGAGLLAVLMTVFGVLQCLLVRRVGRLAPGMAVHAALNGLAVALVLR